MQQDWLSGISWRGQPGTGELALWVQLLTSGLPAPPTSAPLLQVRWMMYWIIFALFMAVETFTDIFVSWYGRRESGGCGQVMVDPPPSSLADLVLSALTGSLSTMRSRWPLCCGCSHPIPGGPACSTANLSTHPCPAMRRYPVGGKEGSIGVGVREGALDSEFRMLGDTWVLISVLLLFCCGTLTEPSLLPLL